MRSGFQKVWDIAVRRDNLKIEFNVRITGIKRYSRQVKMFYEMNDRVIKYGGRIYLGKTPVLYSAQFHAMYPNLNEFLAIKKKCIFQF